MLLRLGADRNLSPLVALQHDRHARKAGSQILCALVGIPQALDERPIRCGGS
jgi:hypothetical protein